MTRAAPTSTQPQSTAQEPFPIRTSGSTLYHQFATVSTQLSSPEEDSPSSEKVYKEFDPESYTQPFLDFLQDCPTVFHTVKGIGKDFADAGFTKISEQDAWKLKAGGKYYVERNGSSLIAFVVGKDYEAGNGAAIIAGHIDALTVKGKK
jgi:aminopeptidase I